ncbi:MAG: hypothetical protein SF051_14825 [Elusimicrobiota bacterium]|nr:hypothetical protein [Elusimicrobiota bacterium]
MMINTGRASLAVLLALSPLSAAANVRVAPVTAGAVRPVVMPVGSAAASMRLAPLTLSAPDLGGSLRASLVGAPAFTGSPLAAAPSAISAPAPRTAGVAADAPRAGVVAPAEARFQANPALSGVAEEAAAYAADEAPAVAGVAAAPAAPRSLLGRLMGALTGNRSQVGDLFDASRGKGGLSNTGLMPQRPASLPNGSRLDDEPSAPSAEEVPGVRFQTWGIEGERRSGVTFESRRELAADPSSESSVETALRGLIDAEGSRYGVRSADLQTVHVRRFTGHAGQADTFFALFRQVKDGLVVHGTDLAFVIKVLDGKPILVSQDATLFPELDVNTQQVLTDEQIMERIAQRTGATPADLARLEFVEQKIVYSRGRWHAVKLYMADGLPFMIAVNVADGTVFAWDNRTGLEKAEPAAATTAVLKGKAVDAGPILKDSKITEVPLPYLSVKLPNGKTVVTDKNGRFTADASMGLDLSQEVVLTAELAGPYAKIEDQQGKTPSISIRLIPGQEVTVVVNPDSTLSDERLLADINAFHKVNMSLGFLRERKLTTAAMDNYQIPVRTNINDECNAYYTPGRPTLNFFRSSKNCVNSAYDTVAEHENGHYWDDKTGGIKNGGLSEGWGDILSMFRLNNPVIGEHFLKVARGGVDYIRHGENDYQYNQYDEVHDQGQAWGGFAWRLRKMLIAKLGYEQGAAVAEALVLPTMFAKARTIPDAMAQVLVNAMSNEGTILHEKEIRAAAKAHGVTLPAAPGRITQLVRWTLRSLGLE